MLGSFGSSHGYNDRIFSLNIAIDPNIPIPTTGKPLRYGKLPEIHHIFKPDPSSPNIVFSLIFTGAVLTTLPAILGVVSSTIWPHVAASDHLHTVAIPRRQRQSSFQSVPVCAYLTYCILRLNHWHRSHILPILHKLEPVQDVAGPFRGWDCHLP